MYYECLRHHKQDIAQYPECMHKQTADASWAISLSEFPLLNLYQPQLQPCKSAGVYLYTRLYACNTVKSLVLAYGPTAYNTCTTLLSSATLYPGRTRITLRSTGEVFTLVPPNCKAHNLIVGRTWVDSAGDYSCLNVTTGAKASMYFTPCGWFGSGHHEVSSDAQLQHSAVQMHLVL